MKISKQARRDARSLFRACMTPSGLDDGRARQAAADVIGKKPRGYIAILSHFQRLLRLEIARRTAIIESATELPERTRAEIQEGLTLRYGAGLDFNFTRKAALIGGVRIQVGGDVYNGSVQGRLAALERSE